MLGDVLRQYMYVRVPQTILASTYADDQSIIRLRANGTYALFS